MSWGAIGGAAVGAVGSMLASSGQPSAPKFKPYSGTGITGETTWDRRNKKFSSALNPEFQGYHGLFGNTANQYLGGNSPTQPFQNFAYGGVQPQIPALYQQGLNASAVDASPYTQYLSQLGGLGQQVGGLAGLFGGVGANYALGGPVGGAQSEQMRQIGLGLLGERPPSYQATADQRLNLLRQRAQPYEERATNSIFSRLYGQGRLGTSGGSQNLGDFGAELARADLGRQVEAQNFGDQLYGRDLQASLARNQMGSSLFGQSLQGLLEGTQLGGSLGAQYLGGAGTSLGALAPIFGNQFSTGTGFNDATNQRAQQRIQSAMQMFGFGNELTGQDLGRGAAGVESILGLDKNLQAMINQGIAAGGATAAAPQGAPTSNPFGALLQGLGGAIPQAFPPGGGYTRVDPMSTGLSSLRTQPELQPIQMDFSSLRPPTPRY